MPLFKIKKSQGGEDSWGDPFVWQHEDVVIDATSQEQLECDLAKVGRPEIYANEFLNLELVGPCDTQQVGIPLKDFLSSYPDAVARLNE